MSNDISISVKVNNQSGTGFADIDAALVALKSSGADAAQSLKTLNTRTLTAAVSLTTLKDNAGDARTALEQLRTQAGDISLRVTVNDDTQAGVDSVKAAVDDLRALGPVTLDVNFNGAAADITATRDALKDLKDQARDAGLSTQALGNRASTAAAKLEALKLAAESAADKIDHLRDSAATAAVALTELRDRASRAATAVGSLRNRAEAAGTRVETLSTHTRTLTTDLTSMHGAATTASSSLSGLRGSVGSVSTSSSRASGAVGDLLGTLISLAPAVVPVAASFAPIVTAAGAAGVALGAFGAALIPQVKQLNDVSGALDTLASSQGDTAVMTQKQIQAQDKAVAALAKVPQATQRAAAAWGGLKKTFTDWSASLGKFTLDPVTRSFAVMEAILPKLSPLVKDASGQLSRLMTLAGGAVSTPGFDALMGKFDVYTNKVLKSAGDETVHFSRLLAEGRADGPIQTFMDYARSEGPRVKQTLQDLSTTVGHVIKAMSDAGPSMLTVIDALARLINAVPPELLGRLMQLYTAFKLIKLAGAGLTSVASGVQSLAAKLTALRAASTAAGGGLAGVRAALATLSTGTKVAGAIAVVAGIALALKSLQGSGKAAPDVQKLTTALGELGRTGKVTGEAARVFGGDFDKLNQSIDRLNGGGSKMDHFNDTMNKVLTLGHGQSNSLKDAKKDVDAVDKSLAQLVQNGQADLAAAAVSRLSAEYAKTGKPAKDLTSKLDDYKSAVADARFESALAADSMGLFGLQAQQVQAKLDAQKASADGLTQSIQALNDVNRKGLSAESDFEQSIDDATKAVKGHHTALRMVNGELDLNTQKARDAYKPLSDLAANTDAAAAAARENGKSWQTVSGIYDRGRDALIRTATQMGLTKAQAKALADQILKTPDKTASLKGDLSDLEKKLATAKAKLKASPSSKTASLKANIANLEDQIDRAKRDIASVKGKTISINVAYKGLADGSGVPVPGGGRYAHGGVVGAASGGPRSRMTLVGEQGPELVDLAAGSRVRSANATKQLFASAGAAGSGDMPPIALTVNIGGQHLGAALIDPLRGVIRDRGGNVQVVLGMRGA